MKIKTTNTEDDQILSLIIETRDGEYIVRETREGLSIMKIGGADEMKGEFITILPKSSNSLIIK